MGLAPRIFLLPVLSTVVLAGLSFLLSLRVVSLRTELAALEHACHTPALGARHAQAPVHCVTANNSSGSSDVAAAQPNQPNIVNRAAQASADVDTDPSSVAQPSLALSSGLTVQVEPIWVAGPTPEETLLHPRTLYNCRSVCPSCLSLCASLSLHVSLHLFLCLSLTISFALSLSLSLFPPPPSALVTLSCCRLSLFSLLPTANITGKGNEAAASLKERHTQNEA